MRLRRILISRRGRPGLLRRLLAAAALGMLLPAAPAGAQAPDVAELVARFESLRAGPDVASEQGLALEAGSLAVRLGPGRVAPVLAGDEVVGLFYNGSGGTLTYRSADAVEHPILAYNLKKNTSLQPAAKAGALEVSDTFRSLLCLSPGRLPAKRPGGEGAWGAAAAAGKAHEVVAAAFAESRDRLPRIQAAPVSHLLALGQANAPTAAAAAVLATGGKEEWLYTLDGFERKEERLVLLQTLRGTERELKGKLFPVVVSEIPVGRDRRDILAPPFLLTDVRLEVNATGGENVQIAVAETIVPVGAPLSAARFDLRNVFYDVVGSGSLDPKGLVLRKVSAESGEELSFDHDLGQLVVGLPRPVAPGIPVRLRFEIEGNFLIRPGGDNYWILGVTPWFPQPDLHGQAYTLRTSVRVPKPFLPFASGKTLRRAEEAGFQVLETEITDPIQFAVVLAGKYSFEEETRRDVTVRVASYAGSNKRAMKQLTDLAFGIIEYYEHFLGPFPFPELNILEINSWGFGQAPPGVVFITKEAFNPTLGEMNQLFSQGINERFAHEIAHQYWGHVVKMPSAEEQWITESFAEYSAALFLKKFRGQSSYDQLRRHWKSRAKFATEAAPIPLAARVSIPSDSLTEFSIRTGLIYDKGSLILAAVDDELEDTQFLTFLKSYQKSFRWKFGSTKTVAGLLQFLTKKDWAPFFEKCFWGTEMPPGK